MSLPFIANTYRCALNWVNTADGNVATNVIHIEKSGSTPAAVYAALDAAVTNHMWSNVATIASVKEVVVTPLDGGGSSYTALTGQPAKWTGNGGSGNYIPQVASIVKLITAKRGRSYRGRVFLPWVSEAGQANGVLDSTNTGEVQTDWTAFVAALTAASFHLVVASYKLGTYENVTTVLAESKCATIRKRQVR